MNSISIRKFEINIIATVLITVVVLISPIDFAQAACATPTANAGALDFQGGVFKYCDGTTWQNLGGGGATTDASLLTSGTLADARLSANVPLKNAANTFTVGAQQITNDAAATIPFIIRAAAAQSATLTEWEDSVGAVIYGLAPGGVPIAATDLVDKGYVDTSVGNYVLKAGDTMTGALRGAVGTAALPGFAFAGFTGTGMFETGTDMLGFSTAGTERIRVLANGNVGIGITNPSQVLDVVGSANISTSVISPSHTTAIGTALAIGTGAAANASSAGNALTITGGAGGATSGAGGAVTISGGTGTSTQSGGALTLTAGPGSGGNSNGAVATLKGGNANGTGTGGLLNLNGGNATGAGVGGAIAIKGGTGVSGNTGGAVTIQPGDAGGTSANGANVTITGGLASGTNMNGGNILVVGGTQTGTGTQGYTQFTGNVGVGVAPARLLHVNGPMRVQPAALPGTPAAGDIAIDSGASNALKYYDGSAWVVLGGASGSYVAKAGDAMSGALSIASASANALAVGLNGTTNPALQVDASTASSATGISVKSAAAAGGVTVQAISSGANEAITISSKGTGAATINAGGGATLQAGSTYLTTFSTQIMAASREFGFYPIAYSATAPHFRVNSAADTGMAAGADRPSVEFNLAAIRQHDAGALPLQRDFSIIPSTHSFVGASTLSDLATVGITSAPKGGTNATVTRAHSLLIQSGALTNTTNSYGLTVNAQTGAANNYAATFMGGNVGMLTATPLASLHLNSTVLSDGTTTALMIGPQNSTNLEIDRQSIGALNNGVGSLLHVNYFGGGIEFQNNQVNLTSGGNFGIGTGASPARLLHVAGAMRLNATTTPASPVAGDMFIDSAASNALKYYDGSVWQTAGGGGGTTDASLLTSGTLADARLSANVAMRNAANTFTVGGHLITNNAAATKPLIIRAAAAQSATLTEWQDSASTLLYGLSQTGVPVATTDLADKEYVDTSVGNYVLKAGDTMTGALVNNTNSASTALAVTQAGAGHAASFMGGKVGIGTATPSALLHTKTTTAMNQFFQDSTTGGSQIYQSSQAGWNMIQQTMAGAGWTTTSAGTTIGTHVFTGLDATGTPVARDAASIKGETDGAATVGSVPGRLTFNTSPSGNATPQERMRITSTGNVGIGTNAPGSKLQVAGTTSGTGVVEISDITGPMLTLSRDDTTTNAEDPLGGIQFGDYDTDLQFPLINAFASQAHTATAAGSYLNFKTVSDNTVVDSERMRITSGGNVGIGTTNPTVRAHVSGTLRVGDGGELCTVAGAGAIKWNGTAIQFCDGTTWANLGGGGGTPAGATTQIQFNNAGAFGASANLVWDNTNKWLGIGAAPTMPLDIVPPNGQYMAARLKGSSSDDVVMQIESSTSAGKPTLVLKQPGFVGFQFFINASGGHNLYLNPGNDFNSPSANSLVFTNTNGNLGLAVGDAPARRLHIDSAMRINPTTTPATPVAGDIFIDSAASNALKYYNGSAWVSLTGGGGSVAGANTQIQFNNAGAFGANANFVWDNTNGRLGIGTASPGKPLSITGPTDATSGDNIILQMAASSVNSTSLSLNNTNGVSKKNQIMLLANGVKQWGFGNDKDFNGTHNFYIFDEVAGQNRMLINSSGNVGIGTAAPRSSLDVSGAIISKAAPANGTATIDFATGNLQYTSSSCGASTFLLHNMKDGGSYSFAVQGGTSGVCAFNAYSDAGSTLLTMHLPQDHGFTQTGKHTIYTFMVMGTHAYAQWIPGY